MSWLVNTASTGIAGSSSMGTLTGLNRAGVTIPSNSVITGFTWYWALADGAGAGTYNNYGTGQFAIPMEWQVGLSFVPTGSSAPNIISNPDSQLFLDIRYNEPGYTDQLINTAGAPAYKDLFSWTGRGKGRLQLPAPVGGVVNFHVGNITTGTVATQWVCLQRVSYA